MKATSTLHDLGQSFWLDNITRNLLTSRTLQGYIDTLAVTGLTSNPTIFDHAICWVTMISWANRLICGLRPWRSTASAMSIAP